MRFIRSRFGIVLWCAIALIITAVPLWRLRATRQVQSAFIFEAKNSPLMNVTEDTQPLSQFGLSAKLADQAAQRFPDDVGAQLAELDAAQFIAQSKDNALSTPATFFQNEEQLERAQKSLAARMKSTWKTTDDYFARYEALERRFSHSNLVRAAHLHAAMTGAILVGEGPPIAYHYEGKKLVPEPLLMLQPETWMSVQAREQAISTARAGASQESDNAFWPWMEAILQFSLGRDDDALRALESAGGKARFNDYGTPLVAQRLATLKRLRAVGWEDEWSEISAMPSAHFWKMRSATRAVLQRMKQARQSGDKKRAFRWAAATARASSLVALTPTTPTDKSVGEALCVITWHGASEGIPGQPETLPQNASDAQRTAYFKARAQSDATRFAFLARENGADDLARQTLATFESFDARQLNEWNRTDAAALPAHIWRLSKVYWLNSQLLRLSFGAALIWCVGWFLTRQSRERVVTLRASMLTTALFFAGVNAALVVTARAFVPEFDVLQQNLFGTALPTPMPEPNLRTMLAAWPYSVGVLWGIFVIVGALRGANKSRNLADARSGRVNWKRTIGFILLGGLFLSGIGALVGASQPTNPSYAAIFSVLSVICLSCSFIGSVLWIFWSRAKARQIAVLFTCALWMGIGGIISPDNWTGGDGLFYGQILIAISALLSLVELFLLMRDKPLNLLTVKEFAFQLAARARIAAGVLALLCAVAYLGITLWTIPVEAKTRAMMQRQLQIGEVAWLREQIAAQK